MKKLLALILVLGLSALPFAALAEVDDGELTRRGNEAYHAGQYEVALDCYRQAAEMGNSVAQNNLAIMYRDGTGVEQSYEKAAEYFKQAADEGFFPDAQYNLAVLYQNGTGVEQSWEKAFDYYQLAAIQGYTHAQYNLGIMYRDGCGVDQSYEKAAGFFRQAARQGDDSAQYNLGVLYYKGQGVEQSYEKAAEYWQQAAEQGDVDAQYYLGNLYYNGMGVEQSYEQAAVYYRQAAEQGYAKAQLNLGVLYDNGYGVEQSYEKAVAYWQQAADQGVADAQYYLGLRYWDGQGVEQSREKAAEYFQMAADQGHEDAQKRVTALAGRDADPEDLRAQAEAAGADLPEPGEGESLYLGVASVPDTKQTRLFLALLLSPNGRSIRWATLFGEALEVPQEGDSVWRINSQTRTLEDTWIPLDVSGTTNLVFDEDGMGLYDLSFENGVGYCRMVMTGHCEKPQDSVDGDYRAEAQLTLSNLTGDAPIAAVEPPTVGDAEAAGMQLPEPGDGEALYLGEAKVSQAEKLYVAFVLSRDGAQLRQLMVFVQNMDVEYRKGNKKVHTTSSQRVTTADNPVAVAEAIDLQDIHLSDFHVDGDGAGAVLEYFYHAKDDNVDYPFDPAQVKFARVK